MYITNVTDYDIMTDDYNNSLSIKKKCTRNESNIDIFIASLLLTLPCGLSFLCLMSLVVFTIIKPFFNIKKLEKILYTIHPIRRIIT